MSIGNADCSIDVQTPCVLANTDFGKYIVQAFFV